MYRTVKQSVDLVVHVGPANLSLPATHGGAVERRMLALAQAQTRELGIRTVLYSRGDRTADSGVSGTTIRYVKTGRGRLARRLGFPLSVARDIARLQPAAIHIHNCADAAPLLRILGLKAPVVLTCDYHLEPLHSVPVLRSAAKLAYRRCLAAPDVIAPVSEYGSRVYRDYWNIAGSRISVVPNGVDLQRFRPDPAAGRRWRERLGLLDRRILLYVGRICEQKGSDLLVKAAPEILRLHGDAAIVAVGPNGQFGATGESELIRDLRRAGVIYVPPVEDDELTGIYNMADVFLMPTRVLEMFGMAAVEAEACGRPVLASDHGGLRETVPESAGIRFTTGDAGALIAGASELLTSPDRLARLSEGALKHAQQYDWSVIAKTCAALYVNASRQC